MIKTNKNLLKKLLGAAMVVGLVLNINAGYALTASTGNGCDNEDNYYIDPTVALCTTHVYNIGGTTNPEDEATRQLMQEVVALKTTVITQQMYKQYEYLETTVRRLKTQLKKAVLASKLEAAGASTNKSSTSTSGSDSALADATDCNAYWDQGELLDCLQRNYSVIKAVVDAKDSNNLNAARNQLKKDYTAAKTFFGTTAAEQKITECEPMGTGSSKLNLCLEAYRAKLIKAKSEYQQSQQKNNSSGWMMVPAPAQSN